MSTSVDLIVSDAAEVLTLAEGQDLAPGALTGDAMDRVGLLRDGAVAVAEGLVVAVGPRAEIEARFDAPLRISAGGGTVMPGFVDPHTHPVFLSTREGEFDLRARGQGYQQITAAGGGIFSSVRALRGAERGQLAQALAQRLDRFMICGTTTIEAKSGYGLDLASERMSLELLAEAAANHPIEIDPTCLAAHQVPPEFKADRDAYVRLVVDQILPDAASSGLARSADVFCDEGAYSVDEARKVLEGARAVGLDLRVHADELAPVGAAELAGELGARTADHLMKVSDAGIESMLAGGTTAVLLPATCFSLRIRETAPARRMIQAGLPVALATDFNPGTSYCPSMVEVVALACGLLGLTAAEALVAATRNAAETLGLPGVRGRLVPGALADLIVLDVPGHLHLGYQLGWNPVERVIKRGRQVWARGPQRLGL